MTVTPIPAVTSPDASSGGSTVRRNAYRVFIVQIAPFPNDRNQAADIRTGCVDRLRLLFSEVAQASGQPRTIDIVWVDTVGELIHEAPHPRELVCYLTESFGAGLIRRHMQDLLRAIPSSGLSRQETQRRETLQQQVRSFDSPSPPATALTVGGRLEMNVTQSRGTVRRVVDWQYSELFVRPTYDVFVSLGRAGLPQFMRDTVGYGIAGLIYHEFMHNKIDPAQPESWDLHNGTGLARMNGCREPHDASNISALKSKINRASPMQYIPGLHPEMTAHLSIGTWAARPEGEQQGQGQPEGQDLDFSGL